MDNLDIIREIHARACWAVRRNLRRTCQGARLVSIQSGLPVAEFLYAEYKTICYALESEVAEERVTPGPFELKTYTNLEFLSPLEIRTLGFLVAARTGRTDYGALSLERKSGWIDKDLRRIYRVAECYNNRRVITLLGDGHELLANARYPYAALARGNRQVYDDFVYCGRNWMLGLDDTYYAWRVGKQDEHKSAVRLLSCETAQKMHGHHQVKLYELVGGNYTPSKIEDMLATRAHRLLGQAHPEDILTAAKQYARHARVAYWGFDVPGCQKMRAALVPLLPAEYFDVTVHGLGALILLSLVNQTREQVCQRMMARLLRVATATLNSSLGAADTLNLPLEAELCKDMGFLRDFNEELIGTVEFQTATPEQQESLMKIFIGAANDIVTDLNSPVRIYMACWMMNFLGHLSPHTYGFKRCSFEGFCDLAEYSQLGRVPAGMPGYLKPLSEPITMRKSLAKLILMRTPEHGASDDKNAETLKKLINLAKEITQSLGELTPEKIKNQAEWAQIIFELDSPELAEIILVGPVLDRVFNKRHRHVRGKMAAWMYSKWTPDKVLPAGIAYVDGVLVDRSVWEQ